MRPFRVSSRLGEATDLAVPQAVVDEGEKFAGGRHSSDVPAATLTDVVMMASDGGIATLMGVSLNPDT